MKGLHAIALSVCVFMTTASVLPELEGNSPAPVPSFCRLENLSELGKCSCFVETRDGTITDQQTKVCMSAFGDDLLSLEDSCKNYLISGKIDVDAVRKDVKKAVDICVPLLFENAQSVVRGGGEVGLESFVLGLD